MEIINQIKNLKNIYDLLALCCEATLFCPDYDYNSGAPVKYTKELNDIFAYYEIECKKSYKKHGFECLKREIVQYLNRGTDLDRIFAIALVIDDRITPIIAEGFSSADDLVSYQALNKQYTDQIRVIPRKIRSFFDIVQSKVDEKGYPPFRKSRDNNSKGIDYQLKNYFVQYADDLSERPLWLHRASASSMLSSHFSNIGQISIGMMPLTCVHIKFIFDIDCENGKFEIHGMKDKPQEDLAKRYEGICGRIAEQKLDFLIFPEMLMTDKLMEYAKSKISPKAFITVNGSIWKECINQSIMTDLCGREIFSYRKKALFQYNNDEDGKNYWEHLCPSENKGYAILEIEGFGRIAIAICKDLLEPEVRNMLKRMNLNLLCVPAYSPSADLHSEARELAEQIGCIVIMVNSCGAMSDRGSEFGFVCMPAMEEGKDRSSVIKAFYNECCYDDCGRGCIGKVVRICFDKLVMHENKRSFAIS